MIGKVIIGKSFRGCVAYCLEDKKLSTEKALTKDRAEVLHYNLCFGNKKELTEQFKDVSKLNLRLSKPVLHITLSLANGEKVNRHILHQVVEDCAKHMGFEGNQYLAVEHKDTANQHLHIIANRVGFDGKTLPDSNSYNKIADFCRQTELKYGLQQVLSPRRFLPKGLRHIPRHDARKQALKSEITNALFKARSYAQFESIINAKGYKIEKGRGIAFIDGKGVRIKGSEVDYSLSKIERILGQGEQRLQMIRPCTDLYPKVNIPQLNNHTPNEDKLGKEIVHNLIRAEHQASSIPIQLLQKKKKKKRRSLHL